MVLQCDAINPCHAEQIKMPRPFLIFSQSDYFIQIVYINPHSLNKSTYLMTNSAEPDQMASLEAI